MTNPATPSSTLLGTGIFGWDGRERRTDRYGFVYLTEGPYGDEKSNIRCSLTAPAGILGRYGALRVRILADRDSGHIGDIFHGYHPVRPATGEEFEVGRGYFAIDAPVGDRLAINAVGLKPHWSAPEGIHWLNPPQLYRAHDQTVELWFDPLPGQEPGTTEPYQTPIKREPGEEEFAIRSTGPLHLDQLPPGVRERLEKEFPRTLSSEPIGPPSSFRIMPIPDLSERTRERIMATIDPEKTAPFRDYEEFIDYLRKTAAAAYGVPLEALDESPLCTHFSKPSIREVGLSLRQVIEVQQGLPAPLDHYIRVNEPVAHVALLTHNRTIIDPRVYVGEYPSAMVETSRVWGIEEKCLWLPGHPYHGLILRVHRGRFDIEWLVQEGLPAFDDPKPDPMAITDEQQYRLAFNRLEYLIENEPGMRDLITALGTVIDAYENANGHRPEAAPTQSNQ